jgi:hypothetical protein
MVSGGGPKINYRQKEDERTCMEYSLASAVHANGYHDLGSWIHNRKKRYMNALHAFDAFVSNIRHEKKPMRRHNICNSLDIDVLQTSLTGIYMCQLLGSDGKDDHCVSISNNWIYDSNLSNAIPRSRESLDLCCSDDEIHSSFVRVVKVAHFDMNTTK